MRNSKIHRCSNVNFNGFTSLSIAYARDVVTEPKSFSSECECPLQFIGIPSWVDIFQNGDFKEIKLEIEENIALEAKISSLFETHLTHKDFSNYFQKYFKNRKLIIQLIHENGEQTAYGYMMMQYKYIAGTEFSQQNIFELQFLKVKQSYIKRAVSLSSTINCHPSLLSTSMLDETPQFISIVDYYD